MQRSPPPGNEVLGKVVKIYISHFTLLPNTRGFKKLSLIYSLHHSPCFATLYTTRVVKRTNGSQGFTVLIQQSECCFFLLICVVQPRVKERKHSAHSPQPLDYARAFPILRPPYTDLSRLIRRNISRPRTLSITREDSRDREGGLGIRRQQALRGNDPALEPPPPPFPIAPTNSKGARRLCCLCLRRLGLDGTDKRKDTQQEVKWRRLFWPHSFPLAPKRRLHTIQRSDNTRRPKINLAPFNSTMRG